MNTDSMFAPELVSEIPN